MQAAAYEHSYACSEANQSSVASVPGQPQGSDHTAMTAPDTPGAGSASSQLLLPQAAHAEGSAPSAQVHLPNATTSAKAPSVALAAEAAPASDVMNVGLAPPRAGLKDVDMQKLRNAYHLKQLEVGQQYCMAAHTAATAYALQTAALAVQMRQEAVNAQEAALAAAVRADERTTREHSTSAYSFAQKAAEAAKAAAQYSACATEHLERHKQWGAELSAISMSRALTVASGAKKTLPSLANALDQLPPLSAIIAHAENQVQRAKLAAKNAQLLSEQSQHMFQARRGSELSWASWCSVKEAVAHLLPEVRHALSTIDLASRNPRPRAVCYALC